MTQSERVLAALRVAGSRGLTQVDWLGYPAVDGGPPITRLAARIQDLKDQGHHFKVTGKRQKCAIYVLCEERPEYQIDPIGPTPLFDPKGLSKPLSPYDVDRAA